MDLDAIEQRAELTGRIRATIAKIDAKPWRGTDEERQQFEAEAIMRAHVGPELDALVARVRELEAERDLLQRKLDAVEGKRSGTWDTWAEHIARKQTEPADPPPKPSLTLEEARRQAAEHARALEEEQ